MTDAADLVLLDGEIHTLTDPDETYEALAARDGGIVRLGSSYDVEFLVGTDTTVIDLDGRVLLPGFVDAHTHVTVAGRKLVHADLSTATSPEEAVDALRERAFETEPDGAAATGNADGTEWVIGYGYDESTWEPARYLTRGDLDPVADDRPVVAFREDMHVVSVNSAALDRFAAAIPDDCIRTTDGEPTGVLVEEGVDPINDAIEPGLDETRELVESALNAAAERGITTVHDMVRRSHAPRVYRELAAATELPTRVRINYWSDHLEALVEAGLPTNAGDEFVQVGAIKSFTDGSLGGRTAKLSTPYDDAPGETGQWVVDPDDLAELVADATGAGYQFTAHAIGDEAVDAVLDAYEIADATDGDERHRIEHVELASDEAIDRIADDNVIASVQPNFLKWAGDGGLYERRIGDRTSETNRYRDLLDAGARLAFGSDGMPMDPLVGLHWAVNAPAAAQRLSVTEALRAYTSGGAVAGFDEDRLGTIEVGKRADLVALADSPWDRPESIRDIDVDLTVVDGDVVYRDP
ncbi:amidohydrolase [Halopenitus persicus]|uniref:amidohydrolase n=1 Tax=Halopenitus persicus TaxID=1048396 RepID=UPI000BBA9EA1|nr:amidohydrolase [Halopenitus persicus]